MIAFVTAAFLQQVAAQAPTTPPSGDTIGYWQQRVHYTIVATLEEERTRLRSRATLVYVNNSPDTLRELYVYQYLNAFRPGSKWSEADDREHRVRFQNLTDPDYGYERFTVPPVVNGTPVVVEYPGAPDSTVARFRIPNGLAPRDSIRVAFEWDARPSTVPRRQGRRGRTYDFAQWYPKVAVYNRRGWQVNPLIPAGELYGEFGTYDVTLVVRDDQVLASTGVPVSGDPGWARVSRTGPPHLAADAYANVPVVPQANVPETYHSVRFFAENVHHFAWSASPDYVYEGGVYTRPRADAHFRTWDTVAVHVLFKPGDDSTWGGGRAVERTTVAARWLESIWGPYAYPQITNVHRLDGGGTEFPMMIMDGSASQGLILHEFGHVFTYGILANNEWQSGWLDEGLTDYQTYWAQRLTPQEQIARTPEPPLLARGYRVNGAAIPRADSTNLDLWMNELLARSEPIGTPASDFREFGIYNEMVYDRARLMYGQLRDVMGDSMFVAFLHDYYGRWALKHVDELAMRSSAERVYGSSLGWFFDQWIHGTGLMDYTLGAVRVNTDGVHYETLVRLRRNGALKHPMPVGVRTASGWTFGRADPLMEDQTVRVVTTDRPMRVELDPYHVTWDWDWRNNIRSGFLLSVREPRLAFNWPYLAQSDRSHTIVAFAPAAWFSDPQGPIVGIRAKTNYLSEIDIHDGGIGFASRSPHNADGRAPTVLTRVQFWARAENPYIPGMARPMMGSAAGINFMDGLLKADLSQSWDLSPFSIAPGPTIKAKAYATGLVPTSSLLLPEQWSKANVVEIGGTGSYKSAVDDAGAYLIAKASLGAGFTTINTSSDAEPSRGYLRALGSIGAVQPITSTSQVRARFFAAVAQNAPRQRAIFASSQDPVETFNNDLFRAKGAVLKQDGVNYLPIGGAGLRGYRVDLALENVVSGNLELSQRVLNLRGQWGRATISLTAFGDAGVLPSKQDPISNNLLSDAGAGIELRGRFYDRDVHVRLDAPVFVNQAGLAGWRGLGNGSFAPRWVLTVGDLW